MIKTVLYRLITTATFAACFMFLFIASAYAQAQPAATDPTTTQNTQQQPEASNATPATSGIANGVCKGVLAAGDGTVSPDTTIQSCEESGNQSFGFIVRRIINIFSIVVGSVSVIMIIIGGFRYIISGGDSSGVSAAKNTILYAIVGLVIVLFAQIIVRFVLTQVSTTT